MHARWGRASFARRGWWLVAGGWWFCHLAQAADLHEAVTSGNVEQVRGLLAAGADVNARDTLGATPLHDAAWTGNREIAALLIAHGAEVNGRHAEAGSTPLDYAVIKDNREVAELLLAHGAAVEAAE